MAPGLSGDAVEAPPAAREPRGRTREAGGSSGTDHALRALEFGRVLELVAARAVSDLGADHVRSLRPHGDPEEAGEALATADEMTAFLMRDEAWAPPAVPDVRESLQRLRTPDSVLEADQVRRLGLLLQSSRRCRTVVLRWSSEFRRLASVADPLVKAPELAERILESVDDGGGVTDAASPALRRTRRDLRQARNRLVERLEDLAAGLPERIRVPDASVTIRGGRYCIPVRREGRSEVGGLVHDESASQQTLFVEPPLAIEPMNRIRELELQERREIRRVLEELTGELRPLAGEMEASLRALVRLDSLHARARYALDHGGHPPELGAEGRGGVRIADGVHPLLEASEEPSVPFDLVLEPEEGVLLVSGPNAGGKTVLLKSVGLLSAMAQSGIVPPAGPGTRLPVFSRFFAVIGDEQSIEASLSTFSAQVENLKEILEESDGSSLVLVDEIGGNTDPGEGSALAAAVLLRLAEQAGLTVATTHLGALKTLAEEDDRIVNASLQFDREALRPTYRLVRDRPGRSWALEIAERMGLPGPVLEEARSRLPEEERAVESLLAELEERQAEAERLASELRRREREVERREEELETLKAELDAREREVEREAREREERYLLEARERVEEAIERLRDRVRDAPAGGGTEGAAADGEEALGEAASEARAEVEEAVREARRRTPERPEVREEGAAPELEEGDAVRIRSLDRRGRVREVRGEDVVVAAGDVRLTLPAGDLELVEDDDAPGGDGPPGGSSRGQGGGTRPRIDARPEVDLRGRRVHEVDRPLLTALDEAVVSGLPRLRIIHGKGTGALRSRVQELLESDGRVRTFRAGEPGEGGYGVTVAELGDGEETT